MPQELRTNYPSGPHVLDGQLLNERARKLNALSDIAQSSRDRLIVGHFCITDDSDTCDTPDTWYDAPCSSRNIYTGQEYVWNHTTAAWELYDDDWHVDVASSYGLRRSLWQGEILVGVWDRLRLAAAVAETPGAYIVRLTAAMSAASGSPLTLQSAAGKILRRNPTTNKLEAATDANGDPITPTIFNWFTESFEEGRTFLAVRDGFGDLVIATGDCSEELESLTTSTSLTTTSISSSSLTTTSLTSLTSLTTTSPQSASTLSTLSTLTSETSGTSASTPMSASTATSMTSVTSGGASSGSSPSTQSESSPSPSSETSVTSITSATSGESLSTQTSLTSVTSASESSGSSPSTQSESSQSPSSASSVTSITSLTSASSATG